MKDPVAPCFFILSLKYKDHPFSDSENFQTSSPPSGACKNSPEGKRPGLESPIL